MSIFHVLRYLFDLLRCNIGYDLELCVCIARHRAGSSCSRDASQASGMRHHYALYILDNVPAYLNDHLIRALPEGFCRYCCGIRYRDRLSTSHRRQQFLLKDLREHFMSLSVFVFTLHVSSSVLVVHD